jgi:septum formation inhibitor-activating ATPase MinD
VNVPAEARALIQSKRDYIKRMLEIGLREGVVNASKQTEFEYILASFGNGILQGAVMALESAGVNHDVLQTFRIERETMRVVEAEIKSQLLNEEHA